MEPDSTETSRARLETEVEAFKTRQAEADALLAERANSRDSRRRDSLIGLDNVVEIGSLMPEIVGVFERTAKRAAEFRDSLRPMFSDLRPKPCRHHPLIMREPAWDETIARSRDSGTFTPAFAPCCECRDEKTSEARRAFWRRRGVEERNIDASLDNFFPLGDAKKTAVLEKVCAWQAKGTGFLLLYGSPGTGKGHLATGCLKAHGAGLFVKQADMLRDLRDSYATNSTTACVAAWQDAGLLVVDEFGLSGGGKDEEPMLYQVLAHRYDHRRPTVITANLNLDELKARLGERLVDRIREDCTHAPMTWESYRRAV